MALFERIEKFTADTFKAALSRMWFLVEDVYIRKIHIVIDYMNFKNTSSSAGYDLQRSDPSKGEYIFHLERNLLDKYLKHLQDPTVPLKANTWEHEIVHLLDHWQLVKSSAFSQSHIPANNLEHYLLKYREEGLANLFDLLDCNITGCTTLAMAKEKFISNVKAAQEKTASIEESNEWIRKELYSGYDFYEVGPWLMLEQLDDIFFMLDVESVSDLEKIIGAGNPIPDDTKLKIIKLAFLIDNNWFLTNVKTNITAA
jgi:hypothetical protein